MKTRYLIIGLLLASSTLSAQTMRAYIEAAENALAEKDYYTAYAHFETAVGIDSNRYDLRYKLAETARLYHAYSHAEEYYSAVVNSSSSDDYPSAAYYLGETQLIQGKYDSAIASFQIYLSEHPDEDSTLTAEANRLIESAQWAKDHLQELNDSLTVTRLGDTVNTLYSEFGAIEVDEIVYFTRLGFERMQLDEKKKREVPPALLYSKVLKTTQDSTGSQPLDSTLNDSTRHTAHITFNHDKTRLYYTICEYQNKNDVRCDLYFRDIVDGEWGDSTKLPEPINAPGFTTTQPNIAYDHNLDREVLYFVSDREGGEGNLDLWYVEVIDTNTFTEPVNLTAVNTQYDDLTPFFHEESNTLYFSTNGRNGFGGYDIFRSELRGEVFSEPVNVGPDYNSSYHDVYYTLSSDEAEALFSSNRAASIYLEANREACCYDVYEVSKEPVIVNLIVHVCDARTQEPLNYVTLYITSRNGDVVTVTQTTGASDSLKIELERNKRYTVVAEKDGYDTDSITFSTYDITQSVDIRKKICLNPSDVVIEVRTFDARQRQPLPNCYISLRDAANNQLDLKHHEFTHITRFVVSPAQAYKILGSRKGYLPDSASVSIADMDGQDTVVRNLYLKLGNLEDFLPLAIYFDNDYPDPNSKKTTTDKRYVDLYDPYYASKERFKRQYSRGLSGAEETAAEAEVEAFFEDTLRRSQADFRSFLNILHQYVVEDSLTFKIFLKGYTSPLAATDYNYLLGQRRINTIQNEFAAYKGGVLLDYIDSGDLIVMEKSFGEDTAPPTVSDDAANQRLSIYSPAASRERRCEIIEIEQDSPQQ